MRFRRKIDKRMSDTSIELVALVATDRNGLTSKLEDVLVTVLRLKFYISEGIFKSVLVL